MSSKFESIYGVSAKNLLLWLDENVPFQHNSTSTWKDLSSNSNDIIQDTASYQPIRNQKSVSIIKSSIKPAIINSLRKAFLTEQYRDFDGLDNYMHQKIYNKETDCGNTTFWPTYAGACFDATNARISIKGAFDPDNVVLGSELITASDDRDFTVWVNVNWAGWSGGAVADGTGKMEVTMDATGSGAYLGAAFIDNPVVGELLEFSVDVWQGTTAETSFQLQMYDGVSYSIKAITIGAVQANYKGYVVAKTGGVSVQINHETGDNTKTFYVDNAKFRKVTNAGLSAFASAANDYMLVIHDGSDKTGMGYIGLADSAEATGSAVIDDDCADDDTGDWDVADCTLTHDTDHYEVVYVADTQRVYNKGSLFTADQMYKLTAKIKNGNTAGVVTQLQLAVGGTFAVLGTETKVTTASWAEIGPVYVVATATNNVVVLYSAMTGAGDYEIKDILAEPVTHVGEDGVLIMSTKGGATQSWTLQEAGIDLNAIDSFEVLKTDFQVKTALSAFMWVKPDDGRPEGGNQSVIAKYRAADGFRGWRLTILSTGKIFVVGSSDGIKSDESEQSDDAFFVDGQETWHYIGFVYNGISIVIYGDGVALASGTGGGGISVSLYDTSEKLMIGLESGGYFAGLIGPTVLASRDYSADEASRLFNADRARFGL